MAVLEGVRVVIATFNPKLQFDNDRFGSSLALQKSSTSTAAFERLADVRQRCFGRQVLNDRFHR